MQNVQPGAATSLNFTDADDALKTSTLSIDAGAVISETTLIYTEHAAGAQNLPPGFGFGGRYFSLDAYVNGNPISPFTFTELVTLTLTYTDEDVSGGLKVSELELRYWNGTQWSNEGITVVNRDLDHNRIVARITHLSQFSLIGENIYKYIYLPLIRRK